MGPGMGGAPATCRFHCTEIIDQSHGVHFLSSRRVLLYVAPSVAHVGVQSNKESVVFAKLFSILALFGILYVSPAHADSFEDASQALENLDELVESVDRTGRALDRLVQPRPDQFHWSGGDRPQSPGWSQWLARSPSLDDEPREDKRGE